MSWRDRIDIHIPASRNRFRFNPCCDCELCRNGGKVPNSAQLGHSLCYGNEHQPPKPGHVNVAALLSFYDEDPAWLRRMILSLPKVPCTHLVALDGAYALYPDGKPSSDPSQHEAIREAARDAGLHLTLEIPDTTWAGNEVEKRNRMFELAEGLNVDWLLIVDADEEILSAPSDVLGRLAGSPFDVAGVQLRQPGEPLGTMVFETFPMFFRAIPGIRCMTDHYTYRTPDGRFLWGNAKTRRLEPRLDLSSVLVEHYTNLRHPDRYEAQKAYYRVRDAEGVEELPDDRPILADAA